MFWDLEFWEFNSLVKGYANRVESEQRFELEKTRWMLTFYANTLSKQTFTAQQIAVFPWEKEFKEKEKIEYKPEDIQSLIEESKRVAQLFEKK